LFNEWFTDIFIPEAVALRPDGYEGPLILLYDGHSTHYSDELLEKALDSNIIILRFPSHSTHLLQPLDLNFFGPLKKIMSKEIRKRVTDNKPQKVGKEQFADILRNAWCQITPSWLKKGFIDSGIHTPQGINRNAISDDEYIKNMPYTEEGTILLELSKQELLDLDIPEEETVLSAVRKEMARILDLRPPSAPTKRNLSKYNHFYHNYYS